MKAKFKQFFRRSTQLCLETPGIFTITEWVVSGSPLCKIGLSCKYIKSIFVIFGGFLFSCLCFDSNIYCYTSKFQWCLSLKTPTYVKQTNQIEETKLRQSFPQCRLRSQREGSSTLACCVTIIVDMWNMHHINCINNAMVSRLMASPQGYSPPGFPE